ncbi:hypothetical protein FJTKL_06623 [Diaporthe vaccinii]|uniref:Uncharacterized protein n=1 Tax=Diaporthe vaccinii TaxID=105482 RepID=A0ABR4EW00_9PEZI
MQTLGSNRSFAIAVCDSGEVIFCLNTSASHIPSRKSNVTEFESIVRVRYQDHQPSEPQKTNSKRQRVICRKCRMLLRRNGSKQYLLHSTPLLP